MDVLPFVLRVHYNPDIYIFEPIDITLRDLHQLLMLLLSLNFRQ